ncbi:Rha family transcriptional regulator [Azotobacter chroococcum]|uniref:Rha family transcriptional regulator n=1 Tax=Azotobacter chroococcum TaxID=353 RepID=UPI0010ADD5A1|nr:Rha family transcriptional regulator [Azotobacter chroococcum]TKD32588.1 Rha protein [Azotobacter chroococcum]
MDELTITESDFQQMVMADDGRPVTTSLKVAKYFKKRHDNVMRAIRQLKKDCPEEFWLLNFEERDSVDARGKRRTIFEMTKDGFVMLVMGFTGKAATTMKIAYIKAFNWMAEQLRSLAMSYNLRRNELMLEYRQEKGIASLAGKTLRRWQDRKPELEGEILSIERDGQYALLLS